MSRDILHKTSVEKKWQFSVVFVNRGKDYDTFERKTVYTTYVYPYHLLR